MSCTGEVAEFHEWNERIAPVQRPRRGVNPMEAIEGDLGDQFPDRLSEYDLSSFLISRKT